MHPKLFLYLTCLVTNVQPPILRVRIASKSNLESRENICEKSDTVTLVKKSVYKRSVKNVRRQCLDRCKGHIGRNYSKFWVSCSQNSDSDLESCKGTVKTTEKYDFKNKIDIGFLSI